jgi:hypothetical protein
VVNTSTNPAIVTFANTPIVQDRDNPARQRFTFQDLVNVADGNAFGQTQFTVPTGKRLVVEWVSVGSINSGGGSPKIAVRVDTHSATGASYFFEGGLANSITGFASSQMRCYADAGTVVAIVIYRQQDTTGSETMYPSLSGYLIDVP